VFASTIIISCNKKDNPADPNAVSTTDASTARTVLNSATLNIHLMDDPARFDAVYVDIRSVKVQVNDSTWYTLPLFRPGVYNLLNFKNDSDTLISSGILVPPGNITKMELILGSNNSVVVRGTSYPLTVRTDSIIRIWLRFRHDDFDHGFGFGIAGRLWDGNADDEDFDEGELPIVVGGVYDIYADFDAGMSVHRTGDDDFFDRDGDHDDGTRSYVLRPVVRAFVKTNTGKLQGQVLPLVAMSTVYASNATDVFTAIPNGEGYFTFPMLPQGNYEVVVMPSDTTYVNDTLKGIVVNANSVTRLGTITLH